MGNDTSKTAIENQQLIMQLQKQVLQHQYEQQMRDQYNRNHQQNQYQQQQINSRLPVISAAELHQRNLHPQRNMDNIERNIPDIHDTPATPSIFEIMANKDLMREIDKNPSTKRKLLEKLLNEHRHVMTTAQVNRINNILSSLPPAENGTYGNHSNYATPSNMKNMQNTHKTNISMGFNQGTSLQDKHSRQLQTTQQLNTIEALTKHYRTEAEEEEATFKIEEERCRKEFEERQRQRRLNYNQKLSDLEKSNIDALQLFKLDKNYSLDDLKAAYKKLAMKTHPDKPTGNAEQFQLVTKCYMSLLEKYKNRESDKTFTDLKSGSKVYLEDQNKSREFGSIVAGKIDKDKFDNKLFNKIYEQNKLWESGDDGYGNWFTSNKTDDAPTEVFGNKFNINVFNSTFEDYKEKVTAQNGAIQEYKDPQELVSCTTNFTDIDIYARKINDFSKPLPVGKGGKNDLAYTDLKTAYTSRGAFIDPSKVNYKTYKSVDELKRDRGNIKYDMNPEQMRDYELKKMREIEEEENRQHLIRQRDNIISNTYSKTHERMLGYKGNASF
jgi:hypothetical protein